MEINQIQKADLLDILFEGRNKTYGAYDLRKTYNRRLTKALTITTSLILLLIGGYTLAGKFERSGIAPPAVSDVSLEKLALPDKPVETPPPPKLPPVKTLAVTIPRIVKDIEVRPEEVPPTQDQIENVKIGTANMQGAADDGIVAPPVGDGGKGIVDAPKTRDNPDSIFVSVQIESSYPGGTPAWQRFIGKNWVTPEDALAKEISGTVVVQFIVDKEGNVSDVQAISGPGELTKEAVRVIKKSGKWTPAVQNGRQVNSYKKQPITVQTTTE